MTNSDQVRQSNESSRPTQGDVAYRIEREGTSVEFGLLPESWLKRGGVKGQCGPFCSSYYAVSGYHDPTEEVIYVRYIHPVNEAAIQVLYEVVERDDGVVPAPLVEETWPTVLSISSFRGLDADPPTPEELSYLWTVYEEYLRDKTGFEPPN